MATPTTIRITPVTLTELTIIVESTNGIEVKTLADCDITTSAITLTLPRPPYSNVNLKFYSQGYNIGILENVSGLGNSIELTPTSDYIKTSDGTNNYYVKDNYSRQFGSDLLDIVMTKAAKSVVDQNNTTNALKYWTGTKAQYDAIATKDSDTIYNVEDTTSPIVDILNTLYPIGAIYIGTMATCPLSVLGVGTWQLVATDRVLQGAGTRGAVGTTINESLPNITGTYRDGCVIAQSNNNTVNSLLDKSGVFNSSRGVNIKGIDNPTVTSASWYREAQISFKASDSSSIYQNNAPVQQNGYLVNIWERTA